MALNMDSYFGLHAKSLTLREARSTQLASNIANMDTPHYKAQDIDFNQALLNEMSANTTEMVSTNSSHLTPNASFSATTLYRTPSHVSLDGNTVDKDLEISEFSKNAVSYQASLSFLDAKIKSMMLALRGD